MGELTFFLGLQVKQKKDGILISQDKYVAEILRKFRLSEGKSASTLIDAEKPLLKDSDGKDVDVHTYRSMIGSLMYLTSSRPDIMFVVCACARFQVTPKVSHLKAVKRIFRYLKGKSYLGLWYPKDSPFDLVAYSDSDYAGCYLRNMVIEIVVLNILSDALPITTNGVQLTMVFNSPMLHLLRVEMVINSPWMMSKNWLVQKQTAFGKDMSSPFMANNLPKIEKDCDLRDVIREILQLDDAEGVVCLPNEEIFAGLAHMGYEKPKGFSGVEIPLFEGMLTAKEIAEEGIAEEQVHADDVVAAAVQETVAEDVANEAIPFTHTLLILPSPPSHDIPSTSQSPVIHQPPQELSIQEMEDLKQQYLDEMKRLSNLEYRDEEYTSAITPDEPVLSTEEPDNSLSMGDEHLDTIPVTKLNEFVKSGVENLIPIPSESEGIPEHVCDVPSHDNSPPLDVSKYQIKDFSESTKEFSSIDDDSFSIDNIDYVEASPPDSELV
nr:hypothetical protein [Tanacetum cinerariifolium]